MGSETGEGRTVSLIEGGSDVGTKVSRTLTAANGYRRRVMDWGEGRGDDDWVGRLGFGGWTLLSLLLVISQSMHR